MTFALMFRLQESMASEQTITINAEVSQDIEISQEIDNASEMLTHEIPLTANVPDLDIQERNENLVTNYMDLVRKNSKKIVNYAITFKCLCLSIHIFSFSSFMIN